jgi:hypothetical protein
MIHDTPADTDSSGAPAGPQQIARQQAIKQIERRRRFWTTTVVAGLGMLLLVVIWAIGEYHNAGGWPSNGFSESSGIYHVWNYWIIYPLIAWVLATAAHAWYVFGRTPISEGDIQREIERQAGKR